MLDVKVLSKYVDINSLDIFTIVALATSFILLVLVIIGRVKLKRLTKKYKASIDNILATAPLSPEDLKLPAELLEPMTSLRHRVKFLETELYQNDETERSINALLQHGALLPELHKILTEIQVRQNLRFLAALLPSEKLNGKIDSTKPQFIGVNLNSQALTSAAEGILRSVYGKNTLAENYLDTARYGTFETYGIKDVFLIRFEVSIGEDKHPAYVLIGYPSYLKPSPREEEKLKTLFYKLGEKISIQQNLNRIEKNPNQNADISVKVDGDSNHIRNERDDMMLSFISHDFRTPISNIKSILHIFDLDKKDHEKEKLLRIAFANCERLIELADNLLTYTKLRSLPLNIEDTPLYGTLSQVVMSFAKNDSGKKVIVTAGDLVIENYERLRELEDRKIKFNTAGFKRVIQNLISNSIKHGTDNVEIIVNFQSREKISIAVRNRAERLNEDTDFSRLFEPFFQLEHTKESAQGTGLGLAIVKSLCEQNGATVTADYNSPYFSITIIANTVHSAEILLIDDNEDFLKSTAELLKRMGLETIKTYTKLDTAFDAITRDTIVIADIQVGTTNSLDYFTKNVIKPKGIIFLSGAGVNLDEISYKIPFGDKTYTFAVPVLMLRKPCNPRALIAAIERLG